MLSAEKFNLMMYPLCNKVVFKIALPLGVTRCYLLVSIFKTIFNFGITGTTCAFSAWHTFVHLQMKCVWRLLGLSFIMWSMIYFTPLIHKFSCEIYADA